MAAAAAVLLLAGLVPWPLPDSVRDAVTAGVAEQLQMPCTATAISWQPLRGVMLRDFTLGDSRAQVQAREVWSLGLLPQRGQDLLFIDAVVRAGRDTAGMLQLPWTQGDTGGAGKMPERITVRGGMLRWHDASLDWDVVLQQVDGTVAPARQAGALAALLGDSAAVPVAASWDADAGRITADSFPLQLLPRAPALLQQAPPVALAFNWRGEQSARHYALTVTPDTAAPLTLELATQTTADSVAFTGTLTSDSLVLALQGDYAPGKVVLTVTSADTAMSEVRGELTARQRGDDWSARFTLRALALPGALFDPLLAGAHLRGPVDLEASGDDAGRMRIIAVARRGQLSGVRGFSNFARRTGLARFHEPVYELLRLQATHAGERTLVDEALFEGSGLGLSFRGSITATAVSGRLRTLFSDEIVRASPELSRYSHLLEKQGGRTRLDFTVSGRPAAPHLEPILPSAPVLVYRGLRQLVVGGVTLGGQAVRQGLSTIFD